MKPMSLKQMQNQRALFSNDQSRHGRRMYLAWDAMIESLLNIDGSFSISTQALAEHAATVRKAGPTKLN